MKKRNHFVFVDYDCIYYFERIIMCMHARKLNNFQDCKAFQALSKSINVLLNKEITQVRI